MERSRLVTGSVSIYGACLATGRILCRPSYSFPAGISPIDSTAIYDKSLYEAEESGNKFETELIQAITGLPNIRWWHRNIARTGFAINGFINHYPGFIVRTCSGKIVIIETKGDSPANEGHRPSCTWAERGRNKPSRGIAISSCSKTRISA